MASEPALGMPLCPQTDTSPPSPADSSAAAMPLPSTYASAAKVVSLMPLFECNEGEYPEAAPGSSAKSVDSTTGRHVVQSLVLEMLETVCDKQISTGCDAIASLDEQDRDELSFGEANPYVASPDAPASASPPAYAAAPPASAAAALASSAAALVSSAAAPAAEPAAVAPAVPAAAPASASSATSSDATSSTSLADFSSAGGVVTMPTFDEMLLDLRRKAPPIVGIRFELLLDGTPDHFGAKCESQLHVVVVREVEEWNWTAVAKLVVMMAAMMGLLWHFFGPLSSLLALYLLNNEQLVREAALGAMFKDRDKESRSIAASVSVVAASGQVLFAALHYVFDDVPALRPVIWFLEIAYGLMLVVLVYSCICSRKVFARCHQSSGDANESFDSYFSIQFNRARSTLVMTALQFLVNHYCLSYLEIAFLDHRMVSVFKLAVMACFFAAVCCSPDKFYFVCAPYFSIPGLPQFHPPRLFVFDAADISRVLGIRHALRSRSETISALGIGHVERDHIDSVCVGHVTTERWASTFVPPKFYNSPAWRRVMFQTYTYLLPFVNFLFLVLFPSAAVSKMFAVARQQFSDDLLLSVLVSARIIFGRVFAAFGWAITSFLFDASDFASKIAELLGILFGWFANGLEQISSYISTLDQWISYVASRLFTLKKVFELLFQIVQALILILYRIVSTLTNLLPYISNARVIPSTAACADSIGRWFLAGWIRNMWLRWFSPRSEHAHNE